MTEQERAALKAEIMAEIKEEMQAKKARDESAKALQPVLDEWFNGECKYGRTGKHGRLYEAMRGDKAWVTWDYVRRLTCYIIGVKYVRDIRDVARARRIANRLCEVITELAEEG